MSTSHNTFEAFSLLPSIASANDAYEADMENSITQPIAYRNYHMGGIESPILFGADLFLPEGRLEVLVSNYNKGPMFHVPVRYGQRDMFEIEAESGGIASFMNSPSRFGIPPRDILGFELCHYNPLIPFKKDIPLSILGSEPPRRTLISLLDIRSEGDDLSLLRSRRLAHQLSMISVDLSIATLGLPYSVGFASLMKATDGPS
ncbi:hypothetical protein FRC17_001041 [Serendipita sp. 399]|nr:hypothetical protein FRC17_001041 [Serendipita sp. 399]